MEIRAKAPAKINLCLSIKSKRKDNYHEVDMVMQTVSLFDIITIEKTFFQGGNIKVICNRDIGCEDKENIVIKVAKKFFSYTGIKNPGISIKIQKEIPIFAGLAGGSSDGAATIVCLNKMFETGLSDVEMKNIGAKVGADIPFCISGGTARAFGIGTEIEKISDMPNCGIVIVKPDCSVSTKEAYDMSDKLGIKNKKSVQTMINLINKGDLLKISNYLFNDFEQLVYNSKIVQAKNELSKSRPLGISMSGSGPSVYGIFENFSKAKECAETLRRIFKEVYACGPISHGAKLF